MSAGSRETDLIKETETVSEKNVQPIRKEKRNYCSLCKIQCTGDKNYTDHLAGKKHLKNLSLSECPSQPNTRPLPQQRQKKPPKQKTKQPHHQDSKLKATEKDYPSKKAFKGSSNFHSMNFDEKNPNTLNSVLPAKSTTKTMNNSNKSNQNNKYIPPDFENRYVRHPNDKYYSDSYRNGKYYCSNRPYNDSWNSYTNSGRRAQSHNYNYRPRGNYFSQYHYNASHENNYFFENNFSIFNSFEDYVENSDSRDVEQNLMLGNPTVDKRIEAPSSRNPFSSNLSSSNNPFKQYYSEDATSSSKASNEELGTEACVSNTGKSPASSKDVTNVFKKSLSDIVSKAGGKVARLRSRSLSSSGSDKIGKDKTDLTESEESEEQRIQEWTNTLLETNHNQITRLIHPSNHKEKAAVNHLITKFSKSKRKEIFTKSLRNNPSELTDNDDRDVNNEDVSAELESVSTEDEEISIILDSKTKSSSFEQTVTNLRISCTSKTSTSKSNEKKQGQNNDTCLESNKSSVNQRSKMFNKNHDSVKDDSFSSIESSPNDSNSFRLNFKEKCVKRKSAGSNEKVKKKQKTTSLKRLNAFNITVTEDLKKGEATPKRVSCPPGNTKASKEDSSVSDIKEEVMETFGESAADPSNNINSQNKSEQNLVFNPDCPISVDTLIQLFASGNVKVKEEFNDPVMDVLKEINPDELMNACTNNSFNASEETSSNLANRKNSKDKSPSLISTNTVNKNCINPVILGSAAIDDNMSSSVNVEANVISENTGSPSVAHVINPVFSKSPSSVNSKHQNGSSQSAIDKNLDHSLSETKVEMPPYLNKLIKQLQDINSQEEVLKDNLIEAKLKINELTSLLDEWKEKKKLMLKQEEDLRKRRSSIIKIMQDAVETDADASNKESTSSLPKNVTLDELTKKKTEADKSSADIVGSTETLPTTSTPITPKEKKQKRKGLSPGSFEYDEITILPPPQKQTPPEIIICDDEESIPFGNQVNDSRHEMDTSVSSIRRSTMCDLKTVNAHATIINSLVVFEEYLYTCSNDNTAKRFSLKDGSLSVTYYHTAKNVTDVVVEKVQNEALVFTSCSVKVISLFIASSGTKIKSFFPPVNVMSICKGWGKFYSGLANGSVNVYNWKYEEREIIKTEHSASRIATAHQGRLHVLVILSSEGNISIRDAETGLLIRGVKFYIKHPAWMCLHNDLAFLSSSDKILIIIDIMGLKVEQKMHIPNYPTGLAVCDDYIFTIAFNGLINCYSKDRMCDKKLFYGAGKSCLTCIHIYHDWVFTGNRKGEVSMFHFDPNSSAPCEFDKCDSVFGLKEDLEYHVEKDHFLKKKKVTQCNWRRCNFTFPKQADNNDKMNHLKSHIYQMKNLPTVL